MTPPLKMLSIGFTLFIRSKRESSERIGDRRYLKLKRVSVCDNG